MSDGLGGPVDHDVLLQASVARFGNLIHVTGYDIASKFEKSVIDIHLQDVSRIPDVVALRTIEGGLRGVYIGVGSVAELDDMGFLRAARPLGWREDTTYADVHGAYDRRRKFIVAGTVGRSPHAQHTMLHEFGHAVGDLLGFNEADILMNHHRDIHYWTLLPPYFRGGYPGDHRGQREVFAELFRDRILNEPSVRRRWSDDLVAWLERELHLP